MTYDTFGCPYVKPAGLLHCSPTLHLLTRQRNYDVQTIALQGKIWYNGKWQFRTKLSEPYPTEMAVDYVWLADKALDIRLHELENGRSTPHAQKEYDIF